MVSALYLLLYTFVNIVQTIQQEERLSRLAAILGKVDLGELLNGEVTFFAPNNEALIDLEQAVPEIIEDKDALADLLKYHVVPRKVSAQDMQGMETSDLETVQGESLFIHVDEEGILVDEAEVVDSDVMADNGILHIIDTVLIPVSVELDDEAWELAAEVDEVEEAEGTSVTE